MNYRLGLLTLTVSLVLAAGLPAEGVPNVVLRSTFKLFNKDSTATCFLLRGPEEGGAVYVVTAGHVLEQATGEEAVLVLRQGQEDGTYRRQDVPLPIRRGEKALWTKHASEDIAVLPVEVAEELQLDPLPLAALATEADLRAEFLDVCSAVWVFGFPARLESNGAGFPIARNATIASYPLVPVQHHRTFMADYSAFAGDSGGPVFVSRRSGKGGPLVLGMVVAQYRNDEKITGLHEERLLRHRLSLGKVVQAEFIRQTVLSAAGSGK